VAGEIHRRAKRKRLARTALEEAIEMFARLGAALWLEIARSELARIPGRRAGANAGTLTATERQVADLVSAGRTNREVAEALFLSVHTVEANLRRIYRKLGVRSRTELAARAAVPPEAT
jgi:DNA-binding CsgD family transcriptional regulator